MKANAVKWETVSADYIDKAICTPTFRECLKRYIELKEKIFYLEKLMRLNPDTRFYEKQS